MIKADILDSAWILIPATGIGVRAGMPHPKQYLKVNNHSILDHTIQTFKQSGFKNIVVILNAEDNYFQSQAGIHTCIGGETRYLSVAAGLKYIKQKASSKNSWVLVHDAVRPCLDRRDLSKLISHILAAEQNNNSIGGILGKPIADTLKYSPNNTINNTVPRNNLWQALTPQMFKLGTFEQAYENINQLSESEINNITDEAYLIEKLGFKPLIIEADYPNPKLTYPQDIEYIKHLLEKNLC